MIVVSVPARILLRSEVDAVSIVDQRAPSGTGYLFKTWPRTKGSSPAIGESRVVEECLANPEILEAEF